MPDNRSGIVYASGTILLALLMRSFAPPCPITSTATGLTEDRVFTDPTWGSVVNLTLSSLKDGYQFSATSNAGRHRALTVFNIEKPGRYRLSVDTEYETASSFMVEVAGAGGKPYARITGDLKTGVIIDRAGDIQASGVEPVPGATDRYRWWIDLDLLSGQGSFNVAILSYAGGTDFVGTPSSCSVIFGKFSLTAVNE
jgi:hypothetical protein